MDAGMKSRSAPIITCAGRDNRPIARSTLGKNIADKIRNRHGMDLGQSGDVARQAFHERSPALVPAAGSSEAAKSWVAYEPYGPKTGSY